MTKEEKFINVLSKSIHDSRHIKLNSAEIWLRYCGNCQQTRHWTKILLGSAARFSKQNSRVIILYLCLFKWLSWRINRRTGWEEISHKIWISVRLARLTKKFNVQSFSRNINSPIPLTLAFLQTFVQLKLDKESDFFFISTWPQSGALRHPRLWQSYFSWNSENCRGIT